MIACRLGRWENDDVLVALEVAGRSGVGLAMSELENEEDADSLREVGD